VSDTVQCEVHGESPKAYVCIHLKDETSGLGFNREDPSEKNPFPDAWCDACEVVRAEHGGWDNVPEGLCKLALLCSECYERAGIRHTRPSVTFEDLAGLRWKCSSCDQWHTGPCLDFGFSEPYYWSKDCEKASRWSNLLPRAIKKPSATFLDTDYCSIEGQSFFVRGLIRLPIIGAAEFFEWGVWGSLSQENFEKLLGMDKDPKRVELPPMFSWLSSQISDYPDTLGLKMYAHIQELGMRPHFRLEPTDHPLAREYYHGIAPERVKEIMLRSLPAVEA
jgi:hypothetical protein